MDANPSVTKLLGYSHTEFLGKKLWEISLFKDIAANQDAFRELQAKKYIRYEDLPLQTKDGRTVSVEFISNVYEVGGKEVIQCNIREITQRKQAEDELYKSEEKFRNLVETFPDAKIAQLKIAPWLEVKAQERSVQVAVNSAAREEAARLDGCYVIKTDLAESVASTQVVHDRYKDLAQVEQAFRTCKTAHLETRPIHVRTAEHTRAHVLVVMLAYLIRRELSRAWADLDITVEEGLHQLQTLCSMEMQIEGGGSCLRIPQPSAACRALLKAADLRLPEALPHRKIVVVTRKKLPERRKPR